MTEIQPTSMTEVLLKHQLTFEGKCICGRIIQYRNPRIENDGLFAEHLDRELQKAGFGKVDGKDGAVYQTLTKAAQNLRLLPPMLKDRYVETVYLYAEEPWRMT